ncbi:hypothetical protein AB9B48_20980 [Kluyvera ascorbata]|uniref:hypothetical protein n=1 Tax=Kluyvera ascorbata TaxID=51288 RepID=UPI00350ECF6D
MIKLLQGVVIAKPPAKEKELSQQEKKQRECDDVEFCCRYMADDWSQPDFRGTGGPHNWRNYITPQLEDTWSSFTDWQKKVIAHALDEVASNEDWD